MPMQQQTTLEANASLQLLEGFGGILTGRHLSKVARQLSQCSSWATKVPRWIAMRLHGSSHVMFLGTKLTSSGVVLVIFVLETAFALVGLDWAGLYIEAQLQSQINISHDRARGHCPLGSIRG